MSKITIKYFPQPSKDNQYVQNTINAIEHALYTKVELAPNLKDAFKNLKTVFSNQKSDIFIINWLENHLRRSNNKLSILGVFKYFIYLIYFRLLAKKIIYVRHNFYPHNMKGWQAKLACYIANIGEKLCHIKVSHSGHLESQGYEYVPHPLYSSPPVEQELQQKHEDEYFIMFGRIERYKKFETIIDHWNNNKKLLIAGSVGDQEYLNELKNKASEKNIIFDARFIPEDEATNLVMNSNGLILAHADKDMIVSGSFFYAITLGVPVFAIEKPFFTWLKSEHDFEGLFISTSSVDLVKLIQNKKNIKLDIRIKAEKMFGDATTVKAWQYLLNSLTKN